jgi:hypothetical protein
MTHGSVGVVDLDICNVTLVNICRTTMKKMLSINDLTHLEYVVQTIKKLPIFERQEQRAQSRLPSNPLVNGLKFL